MLEPYISTYCSLNKYDKGDNLYTTLSEKYIQSLKYYSQLSTSKSSRFSIYTYAENIITDTERYRSLVETVLKSNNNKLKSESIQQFLSSTEFVKELYGNYDYYSLLTQFVEELFDLENKELARELFIKISGQLKYRINIYLSLENKNNYTELILNDFIQLRDLVKTINIYDSNEEYVLGETKNIEELSIQLDKIIN